MRRSAYSGLGLALVLLLVTGTSAQAQVSVGDRPRINWQTVDGRQITNDALKGRMIIVDFWATWCGPCMAEADHMVRVSKEYADKGVSLIGVSLDQDTAKMKSVVRDKGFSWPQVCDARGWRSPIASEWGVDSIPQTVILAPNGVVVWRGHPMRLDRELKEALEKHPTAAMLRRRALDAIKAAGAAGADKDWAKAISAMDEVPEELVESKDPARELQTAMREAAAKFPAAGPESDKLRAAIAAGGESGAKLNKLLAQGRVFLRAATPVAAATQPASTQPLSGREGLAYARLEAAEKLRDQGRHLEAFDAYKELVAKFSDTAFAMSANKRIWAYEEDLKFIEALKAREIERLAKAGLARAKGCVIGERWDDAREHYRTVIQDFPNTPWAAEAQTALEELASKPGKNPKP